MTFSEGVAKLRKMPTTLFFQGFLLPHYKSQIHSTLQRITVLFGDFNVGNSRPEGIHEIHTQIRSVIVLINEPMRTGSSDPGGPGIDSNGTFTGIHFRE